MKMHPWQSLKEGDVVDIIAPGMKPRPRTLSGVKKFLKSWGLEARFSQDIIGRDLICANSQEFRSQDLKRALLAKDSKMIWCLRGGYGSLQLLEDLGRLKKQPAKIFMGLSDITSLHTFLNQKWGWSTIHGCNIDRFALEQGTKAEAKRIQDLLFAKKTTVKYSLKPLNSHAKKSKKIKTSIVGGNLVTLQSSFGTSYQVKGQGKTFFFEDIDERAYRVDRIFQHMQQLKMFKGVQAIIFGQFTGGREPGGQALVPKLLKQFAEDQKIPVFSGLQSGHGPNQHPLPLNTKALIECGARPLVEVDSGVKS